MGNTLETEKQKLWEVGRNPLRRQEGQDGSQHPVVGHSSNVSRGEWKVTERLSRPGGKIREGLLAGTFARLRLCFHYVSSLWMSFPGAVSCRRAGPATVLVTKVSSDLAS